MGQMALSIGGTVVGTVIGAMVGGPAGAAIGGGIGGALGSLAGGLLFPPKTPAVQMDLNFSSSSWGEFIPVLYGTARVPGRLIWAGPMHQINPGSKGGKGGGKPSGKKGNSNTAPYISISFAMAFCEGPGVQYNRIWADGNLIYDASSPGAVVNNQYITISKFDGGEDQTPVPQIIEWVQANVPSSPQAAPAFRGLGYIFFDELNITPFGNRIPNITAECTISPTDIVPAQQVTALTGTLNVGLTTSQPNGINEGFDGDIDYLTERLYTIEGGPSGGIRVVDLSTMKEVSQKAFPNLISIAVSQGGGSVYVLDSGDGLWELNSNSLVTISTCSVSSIWSGGPDLTGFGLGLLVGQTATVQGEPADVIFICGCIGFPGVGGAFDVFAIAANKPSLEVIGGIKLPTPQGFTLGTAGVAVCCIGAQNLSNCSLMILTAGPGTGSSMAFVESIVSQKVTYTLGVPSGVTWGVDTHVTGEAPVVNFQCIAYDQTDGNFIICDPTHVFKYTPAGDELWFVSASVANAGMINKSLIVNGLFGLETTPEPQFTLIDTTTGAIVTQGDVTSGPSTVSGYQSFNGLSNTVVLSDGGSGFAVVFLGRIDAGPFPVADIIQDICSRADLQPSQIDTDLVTATVTGYVVTRSGNGKGVIQQLASAFFFDTVETDYKLKSVPRGQSPSATLTQDDLAEQSGKGDPGNYWEHTRAQQQDVPIQVNIKFMDQDNAYQPSATYTKRTLAPIQVVFGKEKQTLDLPIVSDLTTATNIAAAWLYTLWTERDTFKAATGWQHLALDASDVVTVNPGDGNSYNVRITNSEVGGDYSIRYNFVSEGQQVYTPTHAPGTLTTGPGSFGTVPGVQFAKLFFLDAPLLQDIDDTGGASTRQYYSGAPYSPGWLGGLIFQSADDQSFDQWALLTTQLTWGTTLGTLGVPPSFFATDNENSVTVLINNMSDALTSISRLAMLNGGNMAMIGNEVIQFQNVSVNADGTFTLSSLLRGRRGTEWACSQHAPGDLFVFIDLTNTMQSVEAPLVEIGMTQYFKMVSAGQTMDSANGQTEVFKGYDLKPYAPVGFSDSMSGSDLVVDWVRCTRIGGSWQDFSSTVSLGEFSESYDAYILTGPYDAESASWSTPASGDIVRSFVGLASPTLTYTSSDMASDGFSPTTDILHIVVFQNSVAVGHGWPGSADLPIL